MSVEVCLELPRGETISIELPGVPRVGEVLTISDEHGSASKYRNYTVMRIDWYLRRYHMTNRVVYKGLVNVLLKEV